MNNQNMINILQAKIHNKMKLWKEYEPLATIYCTIFIFFYAILLYEFFFVLSDSPFFQNPINRIFIVLFGFCTFIAIIYLKTKNKL